jgi:hypothetical protein
MTRPLVISGAAGNSAAVDLSMSCQARSRLNLKVAAQQT